MGKRDKRLRKVYKLHQLAEKTDHDLWFVKNVIETGGIDDIANASDKHERASKKYMNYAARNKLVVHRSKHGWLVYKMTHLPAQEKQVIERHKVKRTHRKDDPSIPLAKPVYDEIDILVRHITPASTSFLPVVIKRRNHLRKKGYR